MGRQYILFSWWLLRWLPGTTFFKICNSFLGLYVFKIQISPHILFLLVYRHFFLYYAHLFELTDSNSPFSTNFTVHLHLSLISFHPVRCVLFCLFIFFVYITSAHRSLPYKSGEEQPLTVSNHTNWVLCASLSPSLVYRQCFCLYPKPSFNNLRSHTRSRAKLSLLLLLSGDISTNPGPTTSSLKILCANVQSLRNKGPTIDSFIREHGISCLCLTETHLQDLDTELWKVPLSLQGLTSSTAPARRGPKEGTDSGEAGVWVCFWTNVSQLQHYSKKKIIPLNISL